jgi:hypothetical protein
MLKWLLRRKLDAFERDFDYDASYVRDILAADPGAALRFGRVQALGQYCRDLPRAAWYAAGNREHDGGRTADPAPSWA